MHRRRWLLIPSGLLVTPWALIASGPHHHDLALLAIWDGLCVLAAIILVMLVLIGRNGRQPDAWEAFAAFALAFLTLVGAYASLDLIANAARQGCFAENGQASIDELDAVYFAVTTLSTTGFGDIHAHADMCRRLVTAEMLIGFPALGLAIAGVAARLYERISTTYKAAVRQAALQSAAAATQAALAVDAANTGHSTAEIADTARQAQQHAEMAHAAARKAIETLGGGL
jgi:hypothetical protein